VLHGRRIVLRARSAEDVEILLTELEDDVLGYSRTMGQAWRPHPHGINPPFAPREPKQENAVFTVALQDGGEVLGSCLLWSIDVHNRSAHVGLWLRPAARGQGYGTEVVQVFCHYAFSVLGLHRLQMETLIGNAAMLGAAKACGFTSEGTLRGASWVDGGFADEVVLGLLVEEWADRPGVVAPPS
jgi:RimJ/RimL family protein N-acetyltransferase